ncbi:NAD binding domain of 6-phosphogluconate dehydrogenase domain containing protein [Hyaloscypha variabilis]
MPEKIAFLGLGAMGFGMATNLIKKGVAVTGYDVWAPTLARFVSAGGSSATTPKETVKGVKFVVFMVATAAQILDALFDKENGAILELEKGATVILCSTGPPEYTPNVRRLLNEKGRSDVFLVDAPVSGGTIRAANGTLTILAAGEESALTKGKETLELMAGPNLYVIPGGLGAGTKVKMVHQVLAGIHICMTSEAMGLAASLGVNTKRAFEVLRAGEAMSWMFENRVPHMLVEDKTVYSALNIIVKDMGIVTAGGRSAGFPLFLSSATEQVLASGVSAGLGAIDDAALVSVYLPKDPTLVLKLASASTTAEEDEKKLKIVSQLMAGVHLAATAEAISLGIEVGLEPKQLYGIIAGAAGNSFMFKERTPQLLSGDWTSTKTIDDIIAEMTESIEEANKLKYPLHLGGTALQLFELVSLRGLGKEPDLAVSRVWAKVER